MNKEKIALLVDSGTDVPQEIIDQYDIFVLPLQIIYPEKVYIDKVDITAAEIYQRFPEEIPSTSLPDGATILTVFEAIQAAGYEKIIAMTISSGLSGTYNTIRLLAQEFPALETAVIDTKNVGIGSGLQVISAAELIAAEWPFAEIVAQLTANVKRATVFFNVATLEYLQKGGRIGLVSSIIGNALKLNPVISCNEAGIYHTVAKARGRKKSLQKTVDLIQAFLGDHPRFRIGVAHGQALEEAQQMQAELKQLYPQAEAIYLGEISPALVVHTGPGLLGVGVQLLPE